MSGLKDAAWRLGLELAGMGASARLLAYLSTLLLRNSSSQSRKKAYRTALLAELALYATLKLRSVVLPVPLITGFLLQFACRLHS